MIVAASQRKDHLKQLRDEVEQQRREQYKKAKGLPLTLTQNEMIRLKSMQPLLQNEIVFEEEAEDAKVKPTRKRRASIVIKRPEGSLEPELTKTLNFETRAALSLDSDPESMIEGVRQLESRVGKVEEAVAQWSKWAVGPALG